jgi:hypothetical protein
VPKQEGVDYVMSQLVLSAVSIRNEIEHLQEIELRCQDPAAKRRINRDWNQLETKLDNLHQYILGRLGQYRRVLDDWALRSLKEEPEAGQLELVAVEVNREPARAATRRARMVTEQSNHVHYRTSAEG